MVNVYNLCINSNYNKINIWYSGNATVPSVGVQIIRFTMGLFWLTFWWHFVDISLTLIKFFRTKLSDKYGGYLWQVPASTYVLPDLQRPVPPRNSDLWVTWPVGFLRINPQVLVGDPDSCSPLSRAAFGVGRGKYLLKN